MTTLFFTRWRRWPSTALATLRSSRCTRHWATMTTTLSRPFLTSTSRWFGLFPWKLSCCRKSTTRPESQTTRSRTSTAKQGSWVMARRVTHRSSCAPYPKAKTCSKVSDYAPSQLTGDFNASFHCPPRPPRPGRPRLLDAFWLAIAIQWCIPRSPARRERRRSL